MRKIIDFHRQLASFVNDMKWYQFFIFYFIGYMLMGYVYDHLIKVDSFWLQFLINLLVAYLSAVLLFVIKKPLKK